MPQILPTDDFTNPPRGIQIRWNLNYYTQLLFQAENTFLNVFLYLYLANPGTFNGSLRPSYVRALYYTTSFFLRPSLLFPPPSPAHPLLMFRVLQFTKLLPKMISLYLPQYWPDCTLQTEGRDRCVWSLLHPYYLPQPNKHAWNNCAVNEWVDLVR